MMWSKSVLLGTKDFPICAYNVLIDVYNRTKVIRWRRQYSTIGFYILHYLLSTAVDCRMLRYLRLGDGRITPVTL